MSISPELWAICVNSANGLPDRGLPLECSCAFEAMSMGHVLYNCAATAEYEGSEENVQNASRRKTRRGYLRGQLADDARLKY